MARANSSAKTMFSVSEGVISITMARIAVDHESPIDHNAPLRTAYLVVDSISPLWALSVYDDIFTIGIVFFLRTPLIAVFQETVSRR